MDYPGVVLSPFSPRLRKRFPTPRKVLCFRESLDPTERYELLAVGCKSGTPWDGFFKLREGVVVEKIRGGWDDGPADG